MFHSSITPAPMPAWGNTLQRGDVVLFRFPCAEPGASDASKRRTCLVLDIEMRAGRRFVELAYGTSADTTANVGQEIHVGEESEMTRAGVRRPTRFVCSRRVIVGLDHPGWDINPHYPSPIVGHLSDRALTQMNTIRARIHALRDIATDRRSARGRPFTVEHRRPKAPARFGKVAQE